MAREGFGRVQLRIPTGLALGIPHQDDADWFYISATTYHSPHSTAQNAAPRCPDQIIIIKALSARFGNSQYTKFNPSQL